MITAILFFAYGMVNLAYYIAHGNGKKYVRLFSSIVLFTPAIFITLGEFKEPDFWFAVVGFLTVLDVIVDWRGKLKRGQ